jgi:DNA-nicking Smr family endonuclease
LAVKGNKKKGFQQNPFKSLKGFSVSARQESKAVVEKEFFPVPATSSDEAELFTKEMTRLGLERAGKEDTVQEEVQGESGVVPMYKTDQELFLAALGRMDVRFQDEIPPREEQPPVPRRMKQLRQGKLFPEAKLDLHGLTRKEAREKVRYFLEDSVYQGKKTVLVVTGRGKGSGGEPVLRAEVECYLSLDAGTWVSEWGRAPRQYGGNGALVVFLKGKKEGR